MNPNNMLSADDTTMTILPSEDEIMDGSIGRLGLGLGGGSSSRRNGMEESWNGLFLASSCLSDDSLANNNHNNNTGAATNSTNKKMGHASFTDLGLYDAAKNGSATSVLPKCVEEQTKAQFMKLRLHRMQRKPKMALLSRSNDSSDTQLEMQTRLHESDSALFLRRDSEMDTAELDGTWYRAKHPRHCQALEKMAHSTGSIAL
ncbi:expressed unknown protein [Seminavis robusta]|uniref:Uncharacterized protein n=1 Tax=Seminavis robusta TaxID=568900 RepID=A0A9N8D9W2_9STRA|nr:expressed unknown protein [Seminavis robusta]|eukprot:Sro27_g018370.1 n/a (203) ;mRNA; f:142124-142732